MISQGMDSIESFVRELVDSGDGNGSSDVVSLLLTVTLEELIEDVNGRGGLVTFTVVVPDVGVVNGFVLFVFHAGNDSQGVDSQGADSLGVDRHGQCEGRFYETLDGGSMGMLTSFQSVRLIQIGIACVSLFETSMKMITPLES